MVSFWIDKDCVFGCGILVDYGFVWFGWGVWGEVGVVLLDLWLDLWLVVGVFWFVYIVVKWC